MNVLAKTKDRNEQLREMSKIDGLYVPSIHGEEHVVNKRLIKDLNDSQGIEHPLVPYMQLIHDRVTYELQRGCNRGCRFCQAGMIYRPVRQKNPGSILKNIEKDLRTTGYREVGFLSLNACDYPPLPSVIEALQKYFHGRGIYISLPSLRIESISGSFMNVLSLLPKSGFTIAPEAGSPRLRSVINKNITDEEILRTVRTASELGWSSIKAYFMLGLPTETDEDIDMLIDLVHRMSKEIRSNKTRLVVSFSNFVPKSHTPFQWERQISAEEFEKKLSKLKDTIRDKKISLKWNDPRMSEVEGLFSRGDSRLGNVIYSAYKKGELFSAWGGVFDHSKWAEALKENNLEFSEFLRERKLDERLPWSNIGTGISPEWMKQERKKAYEMKDTAHCTFGDCSACGVCSLYDVSNKIVENIDVKNIDLGQPDVKAALNNDKKYRLRCLYKKTGRFIWMGHFELMSAVEKALLRAKVPVTVSKGFKPTLHLSFSPPVGTGIESKAELVDILMYEHVDPAEFLARINKELPKELSFTKVDYIALAEPSLNQGIESVSWRAYIEGLGGSAQRAFNSDVNIEVQRKGEKRVERLSDYLTGLIFSDSEGGVIMDFEILFRGGKTLKPTEILKAVFPDIEENRFVLVRKEVVLNGVHFSN
jgi:radical SAM-linked protein